MPADAAAQTLDGLADVDRLAVVVVERVDAARRASDPPALGVLVRKNAVIAPRTPRLPLAGPCSSGLPPPSAPDAPRAAPSPRERAVNERTQILAGEPRDDRDADGVAEAKEGLVRRRAASL